MNLFIAARSLLTELVAREIEHLETLCMILVIDLLQFFVLRSEATLSSCVYDEKHLALVGIQRYCVFF